MIRAVVVGRSWQWRCRRPIPSNHLLLSFYNVTRCYHSFWFRGRLDPKVKPMYPFVLSRINSSMKTYSTSLQSSSSSSLSSLLMNRPSLPWYLPSGAQKMLSTNSMLSKVFTGNFNRNERTLFAIHKSLFESRMVYPTTTTTTTTTTMQIRTYVKRKKRERLKKYRAWKELQRRRGIPIVFRPRDKNRPITFRTKLGRLLSKSTRGTEKDEALQQFVRAYPHYSTEQLKITIIPYLSEHFRQTAFQTFFARILLDVTIQNNYGTSGFVWMMQFRADLMDLIYDRAKELKTLDRKVKLMRLRLMKFDILKKTIRKEMAQHVLSLSLKPLPTQKIQNRRPVDVTTATNAVNGNASNIDMAAHHELINLPSKTDESRSDGSKEDVLQRRDGVEPPNVDSSSVQPSATATVMLEEPTILGDIRRLDYNELSERFKKRYNRIAPLLPSRFKGPNKLAYGWFQNEKCRDPDVVTYVSFQERIPTTLQEIVEKSNVERHNLKVATFYGTTVLDPSLEKVGLGEYMIRPVIQQMLEEDDTLAATTEFTTLSPIFSFRNWLLSSDFEEDIALLVVNDGSEDFNVLANEWQCPNNLVFRRLKSLLARNYATYQHGVQDNPVVSTAINNLLLRCAASLIVKAKTPVVKWRCNPLELSTRYHVSHGASVFRLNLAADPSDAGWMESFGMMTNYVYDLKKLESNQAKFLKKFSEIDFHKNITQYVPKPRKLQLTKEQRAKWIPEDPVRKKMIELSQNGKLFKVPLEGPPALSRKKTMHPTLVPHRVRPRGPLPPPVPTVGVSGLAIHLKTPPIRPRSDMPSYVTRTPGGIRRVGEGLARIRTTNGRIGRSASMPWPGEDEFGHTPGSKLPAAQATKTNRFGKQAGRKKKSHSWDQ